jgi:hypothetical protein
MQLQSGEGVTDNFFSAVKRLLGVNNIFVCALGEIEGEAQCV